MEFELTQMTGLTFMREEGSYCAARSVKIIDNSPPDWLL